jgi:membrane-associated phospholipid phosphatase
MLDYLARGFLFFSHYQFILAVIILGFIWFDRSLFYHAFCLALLSALLNVALKDSFQIPLNPFLHKQGFAFPSGHMQLATVFYGWLAYKVKGKLFSLLMAVLLSGIGLGLVHFGYHTIYDVFGGVFFALLLFLLYDFVYLRWPAKLPWCSLIAATFLLVYIFVRHPPLMNYVWIDYGTFVGLVVVGLILRGRL